MKKKIHPKIFLVEIICNCGNNFNLNLTINTKSLKIDVCNVCHPFFSGKDKIVDISGRVESFNKKFNK